jgi:hypothetical protein
MKRKGIWELVEEEEEERNPPPTKRARRSIVDALMPIPTKLLVPDALRELQRKRATPLFEHPRNCRVRTEFSDTKHDYFVDGVCVLGSNRVAVGWKSASGIYHDMFPAFDADAVAKRLQGFPKYSGKTIEEIQAPWNQARINGSAHHQAIEEFLCGKITPESLQAPRGFYEFLIKYPQFRFVALEWPVFDADLKLAGCIDAVAFDEEKQELVIVDWKNCRGRLQDPKEQRTGCHPLTVRDLATKYSQYSIQLNVYAAILERAYRLPEKWGMQLGNEFMLVNFPPEDPGGFEVYKVPRRPSGPLLDLLPWRDQDPLHTHFEFDVKPFIPKMEENEEEEEEEGSRDYPRTGAISPNIIWTHGEWKRAKKDDIVSRYEYEDSPWKHPWGWMVKDVPLYLSLAYYDSWLRCNELLLGQVHHLYQKCLPCWCPTTSRCHCHTGILRRYARQSRGCSLLLKSERSPAFFIGQDDEKEEKEEEAPTRIPETPEELDPIELVS